MEPISKVKKPVVKPKKTKPFFGPKKKLDTKLNKLPKKGEKSVVPLKEPLKKIKPDKAAIAKLKKPAEEIQTTSQKYQKHKETDKVIKETQGAAILSSKKANEAVANRSHVEVMDAQAKDTKLFDKKVFKTKLQTQIDETIKAKKDAEKIKNDGVDESVTKAVSESVGDEKTKAGGKIEASSIVPPAMPEPPFEEATKAEPQKIEPIIPSAKTTTAQKSDLAPQSRPKEETDLTQETKILEDDYQQNNLSKDKLQNSNEPKFIDADTQKQDSETKAQELTDQTRANEKKTINKTRLNNSKAINGGYDEMLQKQSSSNKGRSDQQSKKSQEENKIRNDVHFQLTTIFNNANSLVLVYFAAIDEYIEKVFGRSITRYLDVFSERVAQLLDDNDGLEWLGKKLTGSHVQDDVEIFNVAKDEFIDNMQKPIDDLVDFVDTALSKANKAIKDGSKEADGFWSKQSDDTKRIADEVFEETNLKFKELETTVKSKEGAIIDSVTEKFSAALDELDNRFEKAKIENMSWLDRAIAAVKSVINTIIELKNAIQSLAKKAAAYAERIIDDPITFFGNLADGVGQGFTNFKNNIDKHLVKGVLEWLTGSMGGEIELPKELNFEGITSLVLQILGISVKKIKIMVIDVIGKERFEFIEKGVDATMAAGNNILNIFKILNEQGLSGLWEFIKEEFGNLKEMLIENVKTFVVETITMKAMEYLLSLLIPGAGFIRAAQLLIKFVVTLFQKAAQIIKIIDGILDTFGDILNKNLSAVVAKVEMVFSGFLSLAISFLAAILGLDGIVGKVQKFIQQKIRPKIDQVLKNIALKLKKVADKIGLTKLIDKSMKAVDKGKAWVDDKKKKAIEKGKAGLGKLADWLGIKKSYKSKDGNKHTLLFEESNKKPVMMRSSVKTTFDEYISSIRNKVPDYNLKNPTKLVNFKGIEDQYQLITKEMGDYSNFDKNNVSGKMNKLAELLSKLPDEFADVNVFFPNHTIAMRTTTETSYGSSQKSKDGNNTHVKNLSLKLGTLKGSPGKHTSKLFDHIKSNITTTGQLIRGHLLNHYLGGAGNTPENIMPIAKKTNDAMERSSDNVVKERMAKEKLMSGNVFDYAVSVTYENSTKLKADVPSKITMSFIQKEFDPQVIKNKANMEDGKNWKNAPDQLPNRNLDAKTELENLI